MFLKIQHSEELNHDRATCLNSCLKWLGWKSDASGLRVLPEPKSYNFIEYIHGASEVAYKLANQHLLSQCLFPTKTTIV